MAVLTEQRIPQRAKNPWLAIPLCVLLGVAGLFLLNGTRPNNVLSLLGVFMLLLGASGLYASYREIFHREFAVILNATGIHDNSKVLPMGLVAWRDIEGYRLADDKAIERGVAIIVKNPTEYISKSANAYYSQTQFDAYGTPIFIPLVDLDIEQAKLLDTLERFFSAYCLSRPGASIESSVTANGDHAAYTTPNDIPDSMRIFISYRRVDSQDVTGRIYDKLVDEFGREAIFKDVNSVPFGVDFRTHSTIEVSRSSILLAIIGPNWTRSKASLGDPVDSIAEDFVFTEISVALRERIRVVPVLVSGAIMPDVAMFPQSIASVAYLNATSVRPDPDFHEDVRRLIRSIRQEH